MHRWCSSCSREISSFDEKQCTKCGHETDIEFDVGDTLRVDGRREFKITKRLSDHVDTGMSAVYLAVRTDDSGRFGALKVAKIKHLEALRREADNLQRLRHPNVMRLAYGQDAKTPDQAILHDYKAGEKICFIALEYMPNGSLKQRLLEKNRFSISEATAIMVNLCHALDYAHQTGVIHLDIKPANVLFASDNRVVLSDFGVTRQVSSLSKLQGRVGTPYYNAPEQRQNPPVHTPRADIYALGIMLCEMLVGIEQFRVARTRTSSQGSSSSQSRSSQSLKNTQWLPPNQLNLAVPPNIKDIILKATADNPAERYNSAGELANALIQATPRTTAGRRSPALLIGGAIAFISVALLLVAGAFLMLRSSASTSTPAASTIDNTSSPAASPTEPSNDGNDGSTITINIPTDAPTPTPTTELATTELPTRSPSPTTATSTPRPPTSTPEPTPTPIPTSSPTAATAAFVPSPATLSEEITITLLSPDSSVTERTVTFNWTLDDSCDALPPDYGFELLVWLEGRNPDGAMDAVAEQGEISCVDGIYSFTVSDLQAAPGANDISQGRLLWSVVVVRLEPYERTSIEPFYPFTIQVNFSG